MVPTLSTPASHLLCQARFLMPHCFPLLTRLGFLVFFPASRRRAFLHSGLSCFFFFPLSRRPSEALRPTA